MLNGTWRLRRTRKHANQPRSLCTKVNHRNLTSSLQTQTTSTSKRSKWRDYTFLRENLLEVARELGYRDLPNDFYQITAQQISERKGAYLLHSVGGNVLSALKLAFPEHTWHPWKFKYVPMGWWHSKDNQRQFMEWFRHQRSPPMSFEQLYDLTSQQIKECGGTQLLNIYNGSIATMLRSVYPEHEWLPWRFSSPPKNWALDTATQKRFIEWLHQQLGNTKADNYNYLTREIIEKYGGGPILRHYNYSPRNMIEAISKKNHDTYDTWKFSQAPRNFWNDEESQRNFLKSVLIANFDNDDLNYYYYVTREMIVKGGGARLFAKYPTVANAVMHLYPNHSWQPWKFAVPPRKWWDQRENQLQFMQWFRQEAGFDNIDSLQFLTASQLREYGGRALLHHFGNSVPALLLHLYPDHHWEQNVHFARTCQDMIYSYFKRTLKDFKIYRNKKLAHATYMSTRTPIEVDIIVEPGVSQQSQPAALEYQGERHFFDLVQYGECLGFQMRDQEKAVACALGGYVFIEVPCWVPLNTVAQNALNELKQRFG